MCMTHAIVGGTGKKDKALTLDASSLGNGIYEVTAYYVDHPEEKAELTVEVDNLAEIRILGESAFTPVEESVQIQATYPACDSGKVELSGSTSQDFGFGDDLLVQCSLPLLEKPSGGTVSTETGTWDGICGDARGVYTWAADLFVGESLEDMQTLECLTCGENGPLLSPEETRDLIEGITEQGSPDFNDLKNYDSSINRVNNLSDLLQSEGVTVPGIGNSGFQTQSTADDPPLSNRVQRLHTKYLEAFQQYQAFRSSLLAEASGFEQTYGDYLQNQNLTDFSAIEDQYHPEDIDEYRDEILQLLLETKDNLSLNTYSLASATQHYAELVQLYVLLSKDHFNEKFIGIDLANSNWEPYDPSLEDEPEVIALEKIRNSSHLMRFTRRKINKIANKLVTWQEKIEEKTQPLFDELGIAPSEFTEEYFNNVKQLASEATVEAESALQSFINELPSEDFTIQAENSISSAIKQKANAAIKKIDQLTTSSANKSKQKYDEAKRALQDLRTTIVNSNAPELLAEYDSLIRPLEDKLGFIPSFKISSKLRGLFIEQCLPPQKGECGEGGVPLSNILAATTMYRPTQNDTKKNQITIQRTRTGFFEDTQNEFKKLIGEKCTVENRSVSPKVVNIVKLENHSFLPTGTTVISRNTSTEGIPTLEIQIPSVDGGPKRIVKIRFEG